MSCCRSSNSSGFLHSNTLRCESSSHNHAEGFLPHPYGVYPRGNARRIEDINHRFGTLSNLVFICDFVKEDSENDEHNEHAFMEVVENILSFLEVPELCQLSATCTGWYVLVHCTNAFRNAFTTLSPKYMKFRGSWKESAIRAFLESKGRLEPLEECVGVGGGNGVGNADIKGEEPVSPPHGRPHYGAMDGCGRKRKRDVEKEMSAGHPLPSVPTHQPVAVARSFFSDYLFQSWMCTILPLDYHLGRAPSRGSSETPTVNNGGTTKAESLSSTCISGEPSRITSDMMPEYISRFKTVDRLSCLTPEQFVEKYEFTRTPVIFTDIVKHWPIYQILKRNFTNLSLKKDLLTLPGRSLTPLRCEFTYMNLDDYVRYAKEQVDERPIYMFDSEFSQVLDSEKMYTVPEHFARDDYFRLLGETVRPKYRWIIAGPARGGSSFHVDPNYTHAWNANLTGRKRWLLFPPSSPPPGVVPSSDMSEVATPLSLTEWLLNNYEASVTQLQHVGYECICEPGDLIFVPCGWWHSVVNLQDSVAITQNYISRTNISDVLKFLRAMKCSISGVNEDVATESAESVQNRRNNLAEQLETAMQTNYPEVMKDVQEKIEHERKQREKKRFSAIKLLEKDTEGFAFDF